MHTFAVRYGRQSLELPLPAHATWLQVREQPRVITPVLFTARLRDFCTRTPLDLSRPVLVLADKTRLCGYPEYLPALLEVLQEYGMAAAALRVLIAYGTHPRQSDEECRQAYGELYDRRSFIHHDCRDESLFAELGRTTRGVPIRLRRDLLEASAVITMGAISHHYFAGYGGGRKLIFPGCGERTAIYANHALYLDPIAKATSAGCQPGCITGNPLAEDLAEIEARLPASLAIHGILDAHGGLCDLVVGRGQESFAAACAIHNAACGTTSPRFATVVASCGGFPKDINFIQSHKAVHNAAMFVEDGGQLLLFAECRDGIGSTTFLPWFELGGFTAAFDRLSACYEGNGGTALAMMTKAKRIRIGLVTSLEEKICQAIGVERVSHDEVARRLAGCREEGSLAIIPNASLLVRLA